MKKCWCWDRKQSTDGVDDEKASFGELGHVKTFRATSEGSKVIREGFLYVSAEIVQASVTELSDHRFRHVVEASSFKLQVLAASFPKEEYR